MASARTRVEGRTGHRCICRVVDDGDGSGTNLAWSALKGAHIARWRYPLHRLSQARLGRGNAEVPGMPQRDRLADRH